MKANFYLKLFFLAFLNLCLFTFKGWGQAISFNGTTYTQNFNTITNSDFTPADVAVNTMLQLSDQTGGGSSNTGWYLYSTTTTNNRWGRTNGSSSSGSFFGMRDGVGGLAFGSQGSNTVKGFFGVVIQNTSGSTINSLTITYDAVMNRNPSTTANPYPMSYRVSSSNIVTTSSTADGTFNNSAGTWTTGTGFTTPTSGTGAPGTQAAISPLFRIDGAAITQTLSSLNWGNNQYLYIRWREDDDSGSDATAGVDNFSISLCSTPDALAFVQQPTDVGQGNTMSPAVTVKAYCTSSGATATNYSGNITLTASGGACGYVSQTVAAVNGIATFNNIIFTRSTQTGITLTASASGLTNATSSTFNINGGGGSITTTNIRDENFSGSTPTWPWTSSASTVGSGGTSGADVTGVVTLGGNSYLRKSYSTDNGSSELGTRTIITFDNSASLSSYSALTFSFKIASLNPSGTTATCTGCGVDTPDSLYIETSINNGSTWQQLLIFLAASDKLFAFNSSTPYSLNLGSLTTFPNNSSQSAFTVSIPSGTSQFRFRMIARNNRTGENWAIDDLKLIGESYSAGSITDPLPTALAIGSATICSGNSSVLSASATNSNGVLTYSWAPSTGLSATNTATVTATLSSTQTYTVTITDADNCVAVSNAVTVTVDAAGTPVGDWLGLYNTNWFDCRNWKGKIVPTSTTDVTILSSATFMPEIYQSGAICQSLTVQSSSTLTINDAVSTLEVYGNYTNSGTLSHTLGLVSLKGSNNQTLNCGSSSNTFYNLTVNNSSVSNSITLNSSDLIISNQLTLTDGIVETGANKLILNSATSSNLIHLLTNSESFINGNLRRKISSNTDTYQLPVGNNNSTTGYHPANFLNGNISPTTYLDVSTNTISNSGNNINNNIDTYQIDGRITDICGDASNNDFEWNITPNAQPTSGNYGVDLYVINMNSTDFNDNKFVVVKREDNSSSYADWKTFDASSFIPIQGDPGRLFSSGSGFARRTNFTTFSKFAIGKLDKIVLPITVYDFKVNRISKSKNLIEWKSNDEENLNRYELEKSEDGFNYQLINYTLPFEQNNYTEKHYFVTDSSVIHSANYYKLFSLDNNGKRLYHDIAFINELKSNEDFSIIYSNDGVTVLIDEEGNYTDALIFSSMGQLIKKFSTEDLKTSSIQLNNSEFATSIYFIQLIGKNKTATSKLILGK